MNRSKEVKLALVTADWHTKKNNNKVLLKNLELVSKIAKDLKPDLMVGLGDFADCEGISRFSVQNIEYGVEESVKEWEITGELWEKLCNSCGNKNLERHFCLGNHDGERADKTLYRLKKSASAFMYNAVKDALNPKNYLKDTRIYEHLKVFKFGDLGFFHGEHSGANHPKKHADEYGMNLMYGHLHTYACSTVVTKVKKTPYTAIAIPCMGDVNPFYMNNKSSCWINGFALVYLMPNKKTQSFVYMIRNGTVFCNGKVYKV